MSRKKVDLKSSVVVALTELIYGFSIEADLKKGNLQAAEKGRQAALKFAVGLAEKEQ